MSLVWISLVLILLALALPPALAKKSWGWFVLATGLSFVGVVLPLFVFLFSSFLVPEWKGACAHGALDCFIVGKLALTPFVVAAAAAWYRVEVLRVDPIPRRWVVVGLFLGAVIATVCCAFGLVSCGFQLWLWVPGGVAVWYSLRAGQLIRAAGYGLWTYLGALLATLPFWWLSWCWSCSVYASLPDRAPSGCFVVTAAGRGHAKLVGPFVVITHHGRRRSANLQLLTFWRFENRWRNQSPSSHAAFRAVYNRVGPAVAARITSPWLADLAYLAIKPVEFAARAATSSNLETLANEN